MRQADNPNSSASFWLEDGGTEVTLRGSDDDGDPFRLTLNPLLVNELIEDLTEWVVPPVYPAAWDRKDG